MKSAHPHDEEPPTILRISMQQCGNLKLMTLEDLTLLVDYNYWARDRLLDAVAALEPEQFTRDLGNSFGSVRDTIAHICDAESIWLLRWKGGQPTGFRNADRIPDLAAARKEWAELESEIRKVLDNLGPGGEQRTLEYRDMRGAARSDMFWQMVQHVVNHGSYHRGQVTTMLRQLGAASPKSMDLIMFYRERRSGV
jgi:uncharacterized damage-inducible protein DinB